MTTIKVLSEKPITMSEVNALLSDIQVKKGELNYRANKTHAHLQDYSKIDSKSAKELIDKISKLNVPRMKEEYIVKIVDTLPKHTEEVKALLSGYTFTISQENAKKIADLVKEFC